jgi:hypothetical protein
MASLTLSDAEQCDVTIHPLDAAGISGGAFEGTLAATSSDPAVASIGGFVGPDGTTPQAPGDASATATVVGEAAGTATVTVTDTETGGETVSVSFDVVVIASAPVVIGPTALGVSFAAPAPKAAAPAPVAADAAAPADAAPADAAPVPGVTVEGAPEGAPAGA